jgi:trehalase-like protein
LNWARRANPGFTSRRTTRSALWPNCDGRGRCRVKTAALVGRDGSIDWLCRPRFDSAACFAALLGNGDNGRWLIAPKDSPLDATRRYRPDTLVLETEFQTETGSAAVIDFMPPADCADLVRIVVGRSGRVVFKTELVARFNSGRPCHRLDDGSINAIAGPERLLLRTPVRLYGEDLKTVGEFAVEAGQSIPFVLSYGASFQSPPPAIDGFDALAPRKRSGANGAVAVPMLGLGRKRSNARSSR